MKILIETIRHENHRYPTVGDWTRDPDGTLHIKVSEEIGDKYATLVALHELVEVLLCEERGITDAVVTEFDEKFEENRQVDDDSEPGDDPLAPYRKEHLFATGIEKLMAAELDVNWKAYEQAINDLP